VAAAYSPDLNPAEAVWNHAKYVELANYIANDRDDLWDRVAESPNDQHFRSPLLQSFFARATLKL
jgi:transposase